MYGHEIHPLEALQIQPSRSISQYCANTKDWQVLCSAKCSKTGEIGRTMDGTETKESRWKGEDGLIGNIADLTGCDTNALSLTAVLTVLCL